TASPRPLCACRPLLVARSRGAINSCTLPGRLNSARSARSCDLELHHTLRPPFSIHEFPEDVFTKEQRKKGAVCLHAIYMFYALAIVCDDYFVPSLEKISENLQLSEDVAGATFTSLIGVFITKGDVGVGTIVGSAVFNILVIIGLCGIFAGQVQSRCNHGVTRMFFFPIFDVKKKRRIHVFLCFLLFRWESLLLMTMYGVYIIIMNPFTTSVRDMFSGQAHGQEPPPVIMVDELLILNPHKLSFSEAGLRVMITPHFSPRTRLSMAGRMLISEVHQSTFTTHTFSQFCNTNFPRGVHSCRDREEEDDDEDGIFNPVRIPGGCCARVKWVITWPLGLLLYCTVPNCILPRWHRWFMVTFVASTLWIAVFSYLMVWMVTIISHTLDIPDYIMGITFLAAGTSVPDCMASLIVARQGMGDMAVSNSIGSNIFDILLGLGFPWALRTLVVDHGSSVSINNKGLVYSVILLLASVFLTVRKLVHLNHWRLDRRLGLGLMFLYAIFLLFSILFGQM
uniref:Sodium/calcium exchanger membrane region domain-containing protein n=1 Tax=Mola mola TaxID=94237 RepID=A0A3Q4BMX7_MOLML